MTNTTQPQILNKENKTRYINYFRNYVDESTSMFLREQHGLVETIHMKHRDIWDMYKLLKSLDWSEDEVDYSSCKAEFREYDRRITDMMIRTLAWQWEADSSVSSVINLLGPFITSTPLLAYAVELSKNEILHSLTYSEIVRSSFDNPEEVLENILKIQESFDRLNKVEEVFNEIFILGNKLNLGLIDRNDIELRKALMKTMATLLCLERIQFMSSFVVTFGLANKGYFQPIAKIVQKIATDELQVHVKSDKIIINNEIKTKEGIIAFMEVFEDIENILKEIVDAELRWTDFIINEEGEKVLGFTAKDVKNFVIYSATDVANFLNVNLPYEKIYENPLPFMNKWLDINVNQASPQEESAVNYILGRFQDDRESVNFEV
jgi:ribonucleoside-diphosphate reductase beta chain